MGVKIIVNGIAGAGKTSLLESMRKETFVVSRDGKKFGIPLPHYLAESYVDMSSFLYGDESKGIEGVCDKIQKYQEKIGDLPETIVIDSVSQITMDVIEVASQTPDSWGSQGKEVVKELSMLTNFIHEQLETTGMNVVLLNHVTEDKNEGKSTGRYSQFGQGKFLAKGGFYATANEAITIVPEGKHRAVYFRGEDKQARTACRSLSDKMWLKDLDPEKKSKKLEEGESYFNLQEHIDFLAAEQKDVEEWSF